MTNEEKAAAKLAEEQAKKNANVIEATNPAPESVRTFQFDGFRVKRYGALEAKDALVVEQMQLTDEFGVSHNVTITEAQKPYLPMVTVKTEEGIATRPLQAGDVVRVVCRHTTAGVTNHVSKDGTEIVSDKTTGTYPTAMFDGIASQMQASIFRDSLRRYLDNVAEVDLQVMKAQAGAKITLARLAAAESMTDEEVARVKAKADLIALLHANG